jgi:DNA-directed RNA polymerase specialized sigma24 family protein
MPSNELAKSELLTRLQANEPEAMEWIAQWANPLISRWLETRNLSAEDSDKVFQETLLAVYMNVETYSADGTRGFRGWLRTLMERSILQMGRQRASSANELCFELPTVVADHQTVDRADIQRTLWIACRVIESRFSPGVWQSFWRTAVLSQPIDDVAAALGKTPLAVRTDRARVLFSLRAELRFWS